MNVLLTGEEVESERGSGNVGTEGSHHARVVRFLTDHHVDLVVAEHMGAGMTRMLTTMGIQFVLGVDGDAKASVLAALQEVA